MGAPSKYARGSPLREQMRKAARRFLDFHEREAAKGEIAVIENPPTVAFEVGEVAGIIYIAKGDGKRYIHQFKTRRPVLFASHDGSQVYIVAGRYRFTARGFVG